MAQFGGTGGTWALMPSTWQASNHSWFSPEGSFTSSAYMTVETSALDLGSSKWFYPTTTCNTVNTSSSSTITVEYATSDDDITYSSYQLPQAFKARYIKTQVTISLDTTYEGISSVITEANFDTKFVTRTGLDTSALSGSTGSRTLDLSDELSKIFTMEATATSISDVVMPRVVLNTPYDLLQFSLIDMDSYGKVAIDTTINMVVNGFPAIETVASTGEVRTIQ
jgi:hypothetical protein